MILYLDKRFVLHINHQSNLHQGNVITFEVFHDYIIIIAHPDLVFSTIKAKKLKNCK